MDESYAKKILSFFVHQIPTMTRIAFGGKAGTEETGEETTAVAAGVAGFQGGGLANEGDAAEFRGNDRFEIVREIGKGGMGVVFEAIDREDQSRVALKTMQRIRPYDLYRFKQEFRSLTNITHPNLVQLGHLLSDGRVWFYTMELVDGLHFLDWVRPGSPDRPAEGEEPKSSSNIPYEVDYGRVQSALLQLIEGVEALHRRGKLHRDIKPSNILVRRDGTVKLLDFGLIKDAEESLEPLRSETTDGENEAEFFSDDRISNSFATDGIIAGSIPYMAPEQASGTELTAASDWYAVGTILFEALTGRLPFLGTPQEIFEKKQSRDPPFPGDIRRGLPEDLEKVCHALLSRDPKVRLDGLALLNELRISKPAVIDSGIVEDMRLPFVGRTWHLSQLRSARKRLDRGHATMLHLYGKSGAGKSTLATRFLREAGKDKKVVILAGRCFEQETVPYKALDNLVDSLSHHLLNLLPEEVEELLPPNVALLGKVFPVLQQVEEVRNSRADTIADPFKLRRVAFEALAEMLRRLGERRPLILYIDDLQWGDADSAVFLRDLIHSSRPPRMLFIAGYRSEYRDECPCLRALPARGSGHQGKVTIDDLEVGPLSMKEARSLAELLLKERPEMAETERIAMESGGNPYFVYELANSINLRGTGTREGGMSQLDLDQSLWMRVQNLPETPRKLLEVLAVSGRPIPLRNLYEAAGVDPAGQPGMAVLRSGHLVRSAGAGLGDQVESFHDRIRESITSHLDESDLEAHHLGLATSLEKSGGGDPETIAIHYRDARRIDDACRFYERAAIQASDALAFDRAAKLYRETLRLGQFHPEEKRRLKIRLAEALGNAGRGAESAEVYLQAAEGLDGDRMHRLEERAGYQYCVAGHIDEGRNCFQGILNHLGLRIWRNRKSALLSLVRRRLILLFRGTGFHRRTEDEIPQRVLERIDLSWSVAGGLTVIDPIPAADFQTHNLLMALRAGEPVRIARALAWEASHVAMLGKRFAPKVERYLDEAEVLANQLGDPMVRGFVDLSRCVSAFFLGEFPACLEFGDRAAKVFREECAGLAWELDQSQTFAYWSCYWLGDLAELTRRQERLLAATRERGAHLAESQLTTFGGPFVWLAADDPAGARKALADAFEHWKDVEYQVYHYTALTAKTQIALYEGRGIEALEMMKEEWPLIGKAMLFHVELVNVYLHFLRARCALSAAGQFRIPKKVLAGARRDARILARKKPLWAKAAAHQIFAALASQDGDSSVAVAELERAVEAFDRERFGLHAWCARYRLGQVRGGAAGRKETDSAIDWMTKQGIRNPEAMAAVNAPGFRIEMTNDEAPND